MIAPKIRVVICRECHWTKGPVRFHVKDDPLYRESEDAVFIISPRLCDGCYLAKYGPLVLP
jgi:hypothetical protein